MSPRVPQESMEPALQLRSVRTEISTPRGPVVPVDTLDLSLYPATTMALVGESGSGKSMTCHSIMGLVPESTTITGEVLLHGRNLLSLSPKQMRDVRGGGISMIFQDPLASLNPYLRIGTQLVLTLRLHKELEEAEARLQAANWLDRVGIPDPKRRLRAYPHEISGGMRQRVMIAMALSCEPSVLLADEPTTALDVTVQAQILDLMGTLQSRFGTSILLVSHDLGVVAGLADHVAVMYGGKIVEQGSVDDIFYNPQHPYTQGLLASIPQLEDRVPLLPIPGQPPDLARLPSGCPFRVRCDMALPECRETYPRAYPVRGEHWVRCWLREGRS